MTMNMLDRVIATFSPSWALNRVSARATLQQIAEFSGTSDGYAAGKVTRTNRGNRGRVVKENQISSSNLTTARSNAWQTWRDNPYGRKIVRAIQAKVIGPAMVPESLAVNGDDSPDTEFRKRAKKLWLAIQSGFDLRGMPGQGGQTIPSLQRLALQACILSGNLLYRLVPIDKSEQLRRDLPIQMAIQFIDASRLTDNVPQHKIPEGHWIYRGIEFTADDIRAAYWITNGDGTGDPKRIPASEIRHLFVEDDVDQLFGVTWFSPSVLQLRDAGDLEYNVQKSTAMGACVVASYKKAAGKQRLGLNSTSDPQTGTADGTDLTDADGNAITKLQPGMFINKGQDGDFELHSPNQPNINPEGFVQHMLRGVAAGLPGVKSSTLIGDYRQSSFSSEKSADNDIWPEVNALQDWFASGFCQPIYEEVVKAAVLSGYFEGIVETDEFLANRGRYLATKWQGPVAQSINPEKDAQAAKSRIQTGLSSPQMECARVNVNWIDVLNDVADFYETAKAKGIPEEVVNNIFSVDAQDVTDQPGDQASGTESQTIKTQTEAVSAKT
jgi:lambda family phage portal protein